MEPDFNTGLDPAHLHSNQAEMDRLYSQFLSQINQTSTSLRTDQVDYSLNPATPTILRPCLRTALLTMPQVLMILILSPVLLLSSKHCK